MSDLLESFEEGAAEAEARGDTVLVASDPRELYIDIDNDAQRKQFDLMFGYIAHFYGCRVADRWLSKSGPSHEHIIVVLDRDFTVAERIALQAILGSDPLRDLLTLKRLHDGVEQPIRLFKPRVSIAQQPALITAGAKDDDDDLPF